MHDEGREMWVGYVVRLGVRGLQYQAGALQALAFPAWCGWMKIKCTLTLALLTQFRPRGFAPSRKTASNVAIKCAKLLQASVNVPTPAPTSIVLTLIP